jgi:hypothetical protein
MDRTKEYETEAVGMQWKMKKQGWQREAGTAG